jgi:hypothetical protein
MPAQAIANGLELKPQPSVIKNSCALEMRLLAQVIPFSKIVALKGAAYQGVKGESVYVPIQPDKIGKKITVLPNKLTLAHLVPLMLQRRLRYRGYYMREIIRRYAVINAFRWLRKNNPLYMRNIAYNEDWDKVDGTDENSENLKKMGKKSLRSLSIDNHHHLMQKNQKR